LEQQVGFGFEANDEIKKMGNRGAKICQWRSAKPRLERKMVAMRRHLVCWRRRLAFG
jgi:hypothetical protein